MPSRPSGYKVVLLPMSCPEHRQVASVRVAILIYAFWKVPACMLYTPPSYSVDETKQKLSLSNTHQKKKKEGRFDLHVAPFLFLVNPSWHAVCIVLIDLGRQVTPYRTEEMLP